MPPQSQLHPVRLDVDQPGELDRFTTFVRIIWAIPNAIGAIVIAWFAILFTGRCPRPLCDYVVGAGRRGLRVHGHAFLLVTDRYPPFNLARRSAPPRRADA